MTGVFTVVIISTAPICRYRVACSSGTVAVNGASTTQLRDVTCHMGSHSVTCCPTQVNAPRPNPSPQTVTRFTYPEGMEGWVDLTRQWNGRKPNWRPLDHKSDSTHHMWVRDTVSKWLNRKCIPRHPATCQHRMNEGKDLPVLYLYTCITHRSGIPVLQIDCGDECGNQQRYAG